jgi:DNA-binding response OmpR family regulator
MNLGAKYYILKPFDTEILIKRLQDLINIEETENITKDIYYS